MKQLPVGMETFKEIIENNYLYIDKTKYIYNILKNNKCCFLSRPRRFGKSLILSTLEAIFQEDRKFFNGLWIGSSDYDFKKHPVIRISLTPDSETPEQVKKGILTRLNLIANRNKITLRKDTPNDAFLELIDSLYNIDKKKVVILIDEYDKTVVENLADIKLAHANNNVLKAFFSPLKELDSIIHFLMITGVTKCALASASASLNNLEDISLDPNYSALCGFTLDELEHYFSDTIDITLDSIKNQKYWTGSETTDDLWNEIIYWYDGYNYNGTARVFNPWSILNFFKKQEFLPYWSSTGSSAVVSSLIHDNPFKYTEARLASFTSELLSPSDLGTIAPVPMLYTYGYLTLDQSTTINKIKNYTLRIPNFEVKQKYHFAEMQGIFGLDEVSVKSLAIDFVDALLSRNCLLLETMIGSNLAAISAEKHKPEEKLYHSLIQSFLNGLDMWPRTEDYGSIGKSDIVLVIPEKIYVVIEIKYVNDKIKIGIENGKSKFRKLTEIEKQTAIEKASQRALVQIEDRAYYKKFEIQAKEIIKMGLVVYGRHEVKIMFAL